MATPLHQTFDATQHEPATGPPPPVPANWYNVMITASEMKETKKKTGAYLELTEKILDGPYAGRLLWDRLNIYNPNPVAVEIANGSLSAICHATNVFQVSDAAVLHGIPLMARVIVKPAEDGYDAGNEIKGYAKTGDKIPEADAGPAVVGAVAAPTAAPTAPPGAASAPWATAAPPAATPAPAAPPAVAPVAVAAPVAAPPVAEPTFTPPSADAPVVEGAPEFQPPASAPAVAPVAAPVAASPAEAAPAAPPWAKPPTQ